MKKIEKTFLEEITKEYEQNPTNKIVRHALANTSFTNLCRSQDDCLKNHFGFTIDIKTMSCTNQKSSGRCWIFAGLNVLREKIANKCQMNEFELSQSYVAFFDKFEKINYKLEAIIKLIDKDPDDRTLAYLLKSGIEDGGQWDMFVNVVKKYGIVPKNAMIETYQSSNTREINSLINVEIRKFASMIQNIKKNDTGNSYLKVIEEYKEKKLKDFYSLLINCYGKPVTNFDFEYLDKDNKLQVIKGFTPNSFFDKYIGSSIDDYVSIINAPTKDKPYYKSYTIDLLGNVVGGKDITHLNIPMDRFKELILKQLKDNEIVWFGCDCGKYADRENCVWNIDTFDYQTPFALDYLISKEEALNYHISTMDHAMVLTGVQIRDEKTVKWKVENSWGTDKVNKGYYVMDDKWFDYYVYQAVVNKKYLSKEELDCYNSKPIVLKPWDPMGSLAD